MSRIRRFLIPVLLTVLLFCMFLFCSEGAAEGAKKGTDTVLNVLLPSLFPFFVLSGLLIRSPLVVAVGEKAGRLFEAMFRLPGVCAVPFLLSLVCGFPVGAKAAADLCKQGLISPRQAEQTAAFCSNPGLAFVVFSVGGQMYGNVTVGWILWGVMTASSVLVGFVLGRLCGREKSEKAERQKSVVYSLSQSFTASLRDAAGSMVSVAAGVVFFASFGGVLNGVGLYGLLPCEWEGIVRGFFELTDGVLCLSKQTSTPLSMALTAGVLGWSGLCVQSQIASVLLPVSVKAGKVFVCKGVQGVLAGMITFVLFSFFDFSRTVSVFALSASPVSVTVSAFLLLLSVLIILSMKKTGNSLDEKRKM